MDKHSLSGIEFVSALSEGLIERPPMARLLPFDLKSPAYGSVELVATPTSEFHNIIGTVHGGWIMTMLDTAMALAAHTTLAKGEACASHETSAKFVRPVLSNGAEVLISGKVLFRGRTLITLQGEVQDQSGKLLAHGTSTCAVITI